jgi:chromosome segregation ATPase
MSEAAVERDDGDLADHALTELIAQIERRNHVIDTLRAEIRRQSEELAGTSGQMKQLSEHLARAESQLAAARADIEELRASARRLQRIESSLAHRILVRYRMAIRRIAPPGTRRARIYLALTGVPRRLVRGPAKNPR